MEVDDPSGRVVEACELPRAQAVAPAVGVQRVERPAVAEVETAQHAIEEGRDLVRAVVVGVVQEHRGRGRVRLDVVDLVTEPLEADQVMHRLPDDAGDRHPGHHAEQDDLLPGGDVQANCSSFSDGDGPSSATTDWKAGTNAPRTSAPSGSGGDWARSPGSAADSGSSRETADARWGPGLFRAVDQVHLVRLGAEQGDHPGRRGQPAHPGPDAEAQHQGRGAHRQPEDRAGRRPRGRRG